MKMKVQLEPETEEEKHELLFFLGCNKNKDTKQKKPKQCEKCGEAVDQKVVNFCKVKYKGEKLLCRDCQEEGG